VTSPLTYQQVLVLTVLAAVGPCTVEHVASCIHGRDPFRTLRALHARGLAQPTPEGWAITDTGRSALADLRAVLD